MGEGGSLTGTLVQGKAALSFEPVRRASHAFATPVDDLLIKITKNLTLCRFSPRN